MKIEHGDPAPDGAEVGGGDPRGKPLERSVGSGPMLTAFLRLPYVSTTVDTHGVWPRSGIVPDVVRPSIGIFAVSVSCEAPEDSGCSDVYLTFMKSHTTFGLACPSQEDR